MLIINIQVDEHLSLLLGIIIRLYTIYIPNIQVCELMALFGLVLCLIVNNYNKQTPAIRMKYHLSVILQFAHILFYKF